MDWTVVWSSAEQEWPVEPFDVKWKQQMILKSDTEKQQIEFVLYMCEEGGNRQLRSARDNMSSFEADLKKQILGR